MRGWISLTLLLALAVGHSEEPQPFASPAKHAATTQRSRTSSAPVCNCLICQLPPPAPDIRGTDDPPLIVSSVRSDADSTNDKQDRALRQRMATHTLEVDSVKAAVDWLTLLLALATATVLIVQLRWFIKSVQEMKAATAATRDAATATRDSVNTMEATARRQLKAYVFVHSSAIADLAVGRAFKLTVAIRNYGQTPAYKFKVSVNADIAASFDTVPAPPQSDSTMGALGPGATFDILGEFRRAVSQQEIDGLINGQLTLFIYGRVTFEDAFGNGDRFLHFPLVTGGAHGLVPANRNLYSSPQGNYTDEDAPRPV
jgi:hypothetical protein